MDKEEIIKILKKYTGLLHLKDSKTANVILEGNISQIASELANEITDQEIEKEAWNFGEKAIGNPFNKTQSDNSFKSGAKWYREEIKKGKEPKFICEKCGGEGWIYTLSGNVKRCKKC